MGNFLNKDIRETMDANSSFSSLNKMDSVDEIVKKSAWRSYKTWTIMVLVVTVLLVMFVSWLFVVIPFLYEAYLTSQARKVFMKQFAKDNGLVYQDSLLIKEVKGDFFKLGRDNHISHVVSGKLLGQPIRLFNYQYSVGSGEHEKTYFFTVSEVFFEKTVFPHILLRSLSMANHIKRGRFGGSKEVSLETEFRDVFELYVKKGYEIEAMEIFSKEVLRFLEKRSAHFSIELYDKRLYIYDDVFISRRDDLQELLVVTHEIVKKIGPLLNRLHDDLAVLHQYYA